MRAGVTVPDDTNLPAGRLSQLRDAACHAAALGPSCR
eukprot:SAG22_NODE_19209_length_277_cov_0.584270_1_plen_36_part_10